MKKILLFLIMILILLPACNQDKLQIGVDPRIELLSVMLAVSDYDSIMVSKGSFHLISQLDFDYKDEFLEAFESMQNDPAIDVFMDMAFKYGFYYSLPVYACLLASDYPEMHINMPVSTFVLNRSGGIENLNSFLEALSEFGKRSGFDSFWKNHKEYYKRITANVKKHSLDKMVVQIEDYYREGKGSYNIILVSMFHGGGYGPVIRDSMGIDHIYSIIGPKRVVDGLPQFGNLDEFRYTIWHEFSHSFINPVVDDNFQELEPYACLYEPLKNKLQVQGIADWKDCLTEHLVRAVTVRLTYIYSGQEAGDKAMNREVEMGFAYVPNICDVLKFYESEPEQFPSFSKLFPHLLKLLEDLESEL